MADTSPQPTPAEALLARLRSAAPPTLANPKYPVDATAADALQRMKSSVESSSFLTETKRIIDLPIVPMLTDEQLEAFNKQNLLAPAYQQGYRHNELQARTVLSYKLFGGAFCPIGCGAGKCLPSYTEVYDTENGRRATLEQLLTTESFSVASSTGGRGEVVSSKATAFESGRKPCVKITTDNGAWVDVSTDHPFLTQRGWVKAAELVDGDLLAMPRSLPAARNPKKVEKHVIRLAAYLGSDGGTSQPVATFTQMPNKVLEEFKQDLGTENVGFYTRHREDTEALQLYIHCEITPFIKDFGYYGCLSKHKRAPAWVYGLPEEDIALFLNRFWACDGWIETMGYAICLASEGMIRDIQTLLLRLGIRSYYRHRKITFKGKEFDAWSLSVTGKTMVLKFREKIGPIYGKEEACEKYIVPFESTTENTNIDIVPLNYWGMQEIKDELQLSYRPTTEQSARGWTRSKAKEICRGFNKGYVSHAKFERFCKHFNYSGKYAWYLNFHWTPFKSRKDIGILDVYDLSVPENGNFVAQNLVVHNTNITLMIAYQAFKKGLQRTVLLVTPDVYPQLVNRDIPRARDIMPLTVPFIRLGKVSSSAREIASGSGRVGCYIVPYSVLSTRNGAAVLRKIAPELIIADEAHNLKNRKSAKTKRLMEYIEANTPEFVALSGTMTSKGIADYHHLIRAALHSNSPLPRTWQEAQDWGMVLDALSSPTDDDFAPMKPLLDWANAKAKELQWKDAKGEIKFFMPTQQGYRDAYQQRLITAPGVISSGDKDIGVSILIKNTPVKCYRKIKASDRKQPNTTKTPTQTPGTTPSTTGPHTSPLVATQTPQAASDDSPNQPTEAIDYPGGSRLLFLMRQVNELFLTPNGDEIDHAIHTFKWMYELSAGFYYQLSWPKPEKIQKERLYTLRQNRLSHNFTDTQAEQALVAAKEHHSRAQLYAKELRNWFKANPYSPLDTPMLVGADMVRYGPKNVGNDLYAKWVATRQVARDPFRQLGPGYERLEEGEKGGFGLVERQSEPIPVCSYKVDAAAEWALNCLKKPAPAGEGKGGLIWCHHKFVGRWAYVAIKKAFVAAGCPADKLDEYVIFCPMGANEQITNPGNKDKIVVSSMAHRTGKNLQFMQRQLFLQWPRSAEWAEQAISRIHRQGQIADEITVDTMHTIDFDYIMLNACLNDALYNHQTTGNRQKIIYATYNPLPRIFPHSVLQEKGMQSGKDAGLEKFFGAGDDE